MADQNTAKNNAVALRARLRQTRADIPESDRSRGALLMRGRLFTWLNTTQGDIATHDSPLTVAAFWPMEHEPDLRPLLRQWVENGIRVCLPCMQGDGLPLAFHAWDPDAPLETGRYGIQEPRSGQACIPHVILVPTLGYTPRADRLGYGGGYYDRTLAALAAQGHTPVTIGIAWTEGRLPDDYQPQDHDAPLDAVLTPDAWHPHPPLTEPPKTPKPGFLKRFILR